MISTTPQHLFNNIPTDSRAANVPQWFSFSLKAVEKSMQTREEKNRWKSVSFREKHFRNQYLHMFMKILFLFKSITVRAMKSFQVFEHETFFILQKGGEIAFIDLLINWNVFYFIVMRKNLGRVRKRSSVVFMHSVHSTLWKDFEFTLITECENFTSSDF